MASDAVFTASLLSMQCLHRGRRRQDAEHQCHLMPQEWRSWKEAQRNTRLYNQVPPIPTPQDKGCSACGWHGVH